MAVFSIKDETLIAIADAIRSKAGTTEQISPGDMPGAIEGIPSGGTSGTGYEPFVNRLKNQYGANYIFAGDGCTQDYVNDIAAHVDFSGAKNFDYAFYANTAITSIPAISFASCTSAQKAFQSCFFVTSFHEIDLSACTKTGYMFYCCKGATTIPLKNTGKVADCGYMFYGCYKLTGFAGLDFSAATNVDYMFYGCSALTEVDCVFGAPEKASHMFMYCKLLEEIPEVDLTNADALTGFAAYCKAVKAIHCKNIGKAFDISSCTLMDRDAIMEVIGNLKDLTGTTSQKLTLGTTLKAKLSASDIAVATTKNWTVA